LIHQIKKNISLNCQRAVSSKPTKGAYLCVGRKEKSALCAQKLMVAGFIFSNLM